MTNIDRAVTEEIMGYRKGATVGDKTYWFDEPYNRGGFETPSYSASWEAMGRLIEKMREDGWYVEIRTVTINLVEKYNVLFWNESGDYEYEDKELPMAVAMAALKAKRGE